MKNSFNLGFIVLIMAVLGCSCPKLNELANKDNSSPSPTPYVTGSPGATTTPGSNKTTSSGALTKENFDKIKNGMTYKQVVEILGSEGEEMSSSEIGKYKVASYKWAGSDYSMIYGVFTNDKLTSKTQANLK